MVNYCDAEYAIYKTSYKTQSIIKTLRTLKRRGVLAFAHGHFALFPPYVAPVASVLGDGYCQRLIVACGAFWRVLEALST